MTIDYSELILAFLHDPPDKAIDIKNHEARATRYAAAALGAELTKNAIHDETRTEDQMASMVERLPVPEPGPDYKWAVQPQNGRLLVRHPVSGEETELTGLKVDEPLILSVIEEIKEIVAGLEEPRERFLALWRLLPERLARRHHWFACLPAETRLPDHTIWHHLDITAGIKAALSGGQGVAFLSFFLGPVQPFIAAARSIRDLWSGSYFLS
jgi:CRISPR-associated protein Cmr2